MNESFGPMLPLTRERFDAMQRTIPRHKWVEELTDQYDFAQEMTQI